MANYDLIVIGAGIVGAACADAAAREGLRVTTIEPGPIGGGATSAAMGHLVAMDDDPAELALSAWSLRLWEEFAALPEAEFHRCGTLWVAQDDAEMAGIPAKLARLGAAGVAAQQVTAREMYRLEPALAPGLAGGMRVPAEAVVYPPRMARHLLARAAQQKATLRAGRRVSALVAGGVLLDDGSSLSGNVLVATGCDLPALLPELPLRPRKGHLVITDRYPAVLHHQVLELGYADSAHGTAASSVAFNVQPRPTGQLLIGSSRETDVADRAVNGPILRRMLDRAFRFVPTLRELQAIRIWTGQRPCTPDGRPYIGAVPGRDGVFVAAGHEGLGVATALATAQLLVGGMLGHTLPIDATPYSPARVLA